MKRWQIIALAAVALLGVAVIGGYRMGVKLLQRQIVEALGPGSRLSELKVNWFSVELVELSIDGPKGWPAKRTLEAERVVVYPDLRSLLNDNIRISSIVIEKPYLSMLRTPGKLTLVPSLTEPEPGQKKPRSNGNGSRSVTIAAIEIIDGTLDVFDATVSRPPLRTRIESVQAMLQDVTAPPTDRIRFDISGIVKGLRQDGRLNITGWVGPGARDSSSRIALAQADLVALQPDLVKRNEARVANGTLDLNLNSEVRNNRLDGKGKVVLRSLQFAPSRGLFDTFMGLPRNAVIRFLKDHNDAIDVDFTLTGDTRNPNFSLNEDLSTRIATGMAGQLGVSIRDVAESLGTIGRKGVEGAGGVVEGLGSAVKRLFGGGQ